MSETEIRELAIETDAAAEVRAAWREGQRKSPDWAGPVRPHENGDANGSSVGWGVRAGRWWYVLRYYRGSQLARRALNVLRRRMRLLLPGLQAASVKLNGVPAVRAGHPFAAMWRRDQWEQRIEAGAAQNGAGVFEGVFRFLNRPETLGERVDWKAAEQAGCSRLWRFHLHYQEYLLDLAAVAVETGDEAPLEKAWELVESWIAAHPAGAAGENGDAWHPYCVSRRIPSWVRLYSAGLPPERLKSKFLQSLFLQAVYLEQNLERDLGGNHLLENARGLAVAGAFFEGPAAERWLERSEGILKREIAEQILPHGEHFERSPMYHARMLEGLREMALCTAAVRPALSEICGAACERMEAFQESILHPDGKIALFGDSAFSESGSVRVSGEGARSYAARREPRPPLGTTGHAEEVGDYWVWRHGGDFIILDAGTVGPDHLPAHAHSDLLNFEMSVGGRRLFVDSGVHDYDEGPMRAYCRSTAAHNVLQIDETEQCDAWSRFRMGYRGYPTGMTSSGGDGWDRVQAAHNAYRRIGVGRVERRLACRPGGPWFCVDSACGRGTHRLHNRLHLHPEVHVEQAGACRFHLEIGGARYVLVFLTKGACAVGSGWYCPEFGVRVPSPVINWRSAVSLPGCCIWMLAPAEEGGRAELRQEECGGLRVVWEPAGGESCFPFGREGVPIAGPPRIETFSVF